MTRGGKRKGAGRPATTASSTTCPITFRLGAEDHDRAAAIARDCGVSIGVLARDAFIAAIDAAGAEPTKEGPR